MSFETGTASDIGDLLVKWFNFLQANGWTADVDWVTSGQSPSWGIIRRGNSQSPEDENSVNLQCAFAVADFDATDGENMNMIPMRGYSSGDPEDAVEVATSTARYGKISGSSHIKTNFPAEPFENYWFFESDFYAHAVVEYSSVDDAGTTRRLKSFGIITKIEATVLTFLPSLNAHDQGVGTVTANLFEMNLHRHDLFDENNASLSQDVELLWFPTLSVFDSVVTMFFCSVTVF